MLDYFMIMIGISIGMITDNFIGASDGCSIGMGIDYILQEKI